MIWIGYALISILTAAMGLFLGGVIGSACVEWYQISSFEGKSGFFVIGMALIGAILGFVVGLITVCALGPTNGLGLLKTWGFSNLAAIVLSCITYAACWFLADIPPQIDGQQLMLDVEVKLPVTVTHSPVSGTGESYLRLYSVIGQTSRKSKDGQWNVQQARLEDGRWIVPGSVELFTMRGSRSLIFKLNGEELLGYGVPLPARPNRKFLEWSEWGPRPKVSSPPWPESKPSYRFRVRKIECR